MIIKLFPTANSVVDRVSVQVSKYSEENGGSNSGTLYIVEVVFPDGQWIQSSHHRVLEAAQRAAREEATARGAELLTHSLWPYCNLP